LTILLSELATVRLVCKKCRTAIELDLAGLRTKLGNAECPCCNNDFPEDDHGHRLLAELARTLPALRKDSKAVEVEFVIPDSA
jgi:hypothetical protein